MPLQQPRIKSALGSGGPVIIKNNLTSISEFKMKIVTTSGGASTNLSLFPGPVPTHTAAKFGITYADQSAVKISTTIGANDQTGLDETNKYLEQVGMYISYIRMITSSTSIYDGSLFLGEMPPNGIANPEEVSLSPYASVIGGGGYDKTLLIADKPISNTRNFFMYLSAMPASATLDIAFGVAAIGNTFSAEATNQ